MLTFVWEPKTVPARVGWTWKNVKNARSSMMKSCSNAQKKSILPVGWFVPWNLSVRIPFAQKIIFYGHSLCSTYFAMVPGKQFGKPVQHKQNKAQGFRVGIFQERCGIGIKLLALRFLKLINILKIRLRIATPIRIPPPVDSTYLQRTFEQHFESQCSPMQTGKN